MNKLILLLSSLLITCNTPTIDKRENSKKDNVIEYENDNRKTRKHLKKLMKQKIKGQLPFNDFKYACVENGFAVIVDESWCFWIDKNDSIWCVNGTSKSIMHRKDGTLDCKNAPISIGYLEISAIAE